MNRPRQDWMVIGAVSTVHFVSHIHILALAPLFPLLKRDFDCSYTTLGLIVIGYNLVTAVLQTPMGRLTDRYGGPGLLMLAQIGAAIAFLGASFSQSLWQLTAFISLAGLANAIYHPADMAVLSSYVSPSRRSSAFATHSLAGIAGFAAAPLTIGSLALMTDWRTGLMLAATFSCLGLIALLVLKPLAGQATKAPKPHIKPNVKAWRSPVFRRQFALFAAFGAISAGSQGFLVPALLLNTTMTLPVATALLSAFLIAITAGVALGGLVAGRLSPARALTWGMGSSALGWALASISALPVPLLMALICFAGLANGLSLPSRDTMLANQAEGPNQATIFGFVTAGLGAGQVIAPLLAGPLVDHGLSAALLPMLSLLSLACLLGRDAPEDPKTDLQLQSLPK